jgi:hypothetical protein
MNNTAGSNPSDYTVPAVEVARRLGKSLTTLQRYRDSDDTDPYHLYGLKKGRFWYYREQDIREHEQRLANLPKSSKRLPPHRGHTNDAGRDDS